MNQTFKVLFAITAFIVSACDQGPKATPTQSPPAPSSETPASSQGAQQNSAAKPDPKDEEAPKTEDTQSPWQYSQVEDKLTLKKTYYAEVESENEVTFGFPYRGPQRARLILRTHPQFGKDVILQIERGQILCRSYDGCNVKVRFGTSTPVNFSAAGPSDNSTEVIFIRNYNSFVSKMMKADVVAIQIEVYQEGAPVFEFKVKGFDPKKYRPDN